MKRQPEISVIVPVFNSDKRIELCLNSILAQTFENFEVICIDDGSTDSSSEIIKKFTEKDHRFKLIKQANKGTSAARNMGLSEAKGIYICFIDSDDTLDNKTFALAIDKAYKTNADIVQYNFIREYANCSIVQPSPRDKFFTFKDTGLIRLILWDKIIRKDILQGISFSPSMTYFEDSLFIFQAYLNSSKNYFFNMPLYSYHIRKNSLSQNLSSKHINYVKQGIAEIEKITYSAGLYKKCMKVIIFLKLYVKLLYMKVFNPPDFNTARKIYPEANKYFYIAGDYYRIAAMLLLILRLDFILKPLIKFWKNRKNQPKPFEY